MVRSRAVDIALCLHRRIPDPWKAVCYSDRNYQFATHRVESGSFRVLLQPMLLLTLMTLAILISKVVSLIDAVVRVHVRIYLKGRRK